MAWQVAAVAAVAAAVAAAETSITSAVCRRARLIEISKWGCAGSWMAWASPPSGTILKLVLMMRTWHGFVHGSCGRRIAAAVAAAETALAFAVRRRARLVEISKCVA